MERFISSHLFQKGVTKFRAFGQYLGHSDYFSGLFFGIGVQPGVLGNARPPRTRLVTWWTLEG